MLGQSVGSNRAYRGQEHSVQEIADVDAMKHFDEVIYRRGGGEGYSVNGLIKEHFFNSFNILT
jgi:hypothetical protein